MIETPMDVLHRFPVRKSKRQKQAFRDAVQSYAQSLGYKTRIEKGKWGCQNVIIGDPETALYLITSNVRNTSGVVTLLETAVSMPRNLRERVCYVLFDGKMFGASSHRRKHRYASDLQTVLNLDCVGDGDTVMLIPNKGMKADEEELRRLIELERRCGEKRVRVRDKGFAVFPSDQMQFPRGVGICALHKNKLCHCCGRIHTFRDTILDYTNVNILRACLITYISGGAAD